MASYSLTGRGNTNVQSLVVMLVGNAHPPMGGHVGPPLPPLPFTENGKIKDLPPHGLGMGLPNISIFNG